MNKEISVYDNSISARTYLSYIAEQAGGIAIIGRDGKLYIKTFGESIVELPLNRFKDFKWGEKFKITRVYYEDGIQRFEQGDTTGNTVYISQDNMYIVEQEQIDNIYNEVKDLEIYSFEGTTVIDPAIDVGDILLIDGKKVIYQGSSEYAGHFIASISSKIQCKAKEETTTRTPSQATINRRVQSQIDQATGKITLLSESVESINKQAITQVKVLYALSNSATEAPTSGWSETAPEWQNGKYMWQKTATTNGVSTTYSEATCIQGAKGQDGENGKDGQDGVNGKDGANGSDGKSAYQIWLDAGNTGTEEDYLASLKGEQGETGAKGDKGDTGAKGDKGDTGAKGDQGDKGDTGIGVQEIVAQYYLSSSNSTQIDGEWKETQDEWQDGKFMWTRSKIIWTDNTVTYTTPILATSTNQTNQKIAQIELTNEQIEQTVASNKIASDNDKQELLQKFDNYAPSSEITRVENKVTQLQTDTYTKTQIDTKLVDGSVTKLKSTTLLADDDGLTVDKSDSKTKSNLDADGLTILDKTGSTNDVLLRAQYDEEKGETVVETKNLYVQKYLTVAETGRLEKYTRADGKVGVGGFYVGG